LLITLSVLLLGSQITAVQLFGYSITLTGLFVYKQTSGKEPPFLADFIAKVKSKPSRWYHVGGGALAVVALAGLLLLPPLELL
jgi:hypothetical protein